MARALLGHDITVDDYGELETLVTLPQWLAYAMADLIATVRNALRDPKSPPTYRDEMLDAWGLHNEAIRYRKVVEASRAKASSDALAAFAQRYAQ